MRVLGFRLPLLVLCTLAAAGCTQTTRVADDLTIESLSKAKRAVAVMRLGAATTSCQHIGVWLGVRDGNGFRRHRPVVIANERSTTDVPVAEIELDPGEYHVISYACMTAKGLKMVEDEDGSGVQRSSIASFKLGPGEIVNVGYLHFHASRVGLNAFGRPLRTRVTITDLPVDELQRFKAKRPQIYAQMTTRLMTATAVAEEDCGQLVQLKADGKIQNLPAACATGAASAPSAAKLVKKY